jgi:hypothetical protein
LLLLCAVNGRPSSLRYYLNYGLNRTYQQCLATFTCLLKSIKSLHLGRLQVLAAYIFYRKNVLRVERFFYSPAVSPSYCTTISSWSKFERQKKKRYRDFLLFLKNGCYHTHTNKYIRLNYSKSMYNLKCFSCTPTRWIVLQETSCR